MFVTLIIIFSVIYGFLSLSWLPFIWRQARKRKSLYWLQVFRFLGGTIYGLLTYLVYNYDLTPSAFISRFLLVFSLLTLIDVFRSINHMIDDDHWGFQMFVGFLGLIIVFVLSAIYPFWIAKDRYEAVQAHITEEPMKETNEQHIPVVPKEYALYKMEKVIGKVPNYFYYDLSKPSIQKINGHLYWVSALEYKNVFRWFNAGKVPGYIKISAEDPRTDAEFIASEMKYVPSALFHESALHLAHFRNPQVVLMEASFEPDESGKPYYAISYGNYEKYRNIRKVEGVILLDPVTGASKTYPLKEVPDFVDQVIPMNVAYERNIWFGKFKYGFFNSILGKQDVHIPTEWNNEDEMVAVFDKERNMYWSTDHTRDDKDSGSMVGYSLMNTRTGELTYYSGTNGYLNGLTAKNLAEKTFREKGWTTGSPVLYNIFGEYTWVLQAMDTNHVLRKIILVNAEDEKVVGYGDFKGEAFNMYQFNISTNKEGDTETPTNDARLTSLMGKVTAVYKYHINDQTIVQFMVDQSEHIFTVGTKTAPYAVFLEEGQEVEISFIETNEITVGITKLKNKTLGK